jgi:WhiB family redox-sensing transcriptional regulator
VDPRQPGFTAFVFPGPSIEQMKLAEMNAGGGLVTTPVLESLGVEDELGELPCRLVDPEVFFAESPVDVENAKALCRDCPVRAVCLAGALDRREPWGVWGGELFVQGVVVARKRPRGRPRKYPVAEPFAPAAKSDAQEAAA